MLEAKLEPPPIPCPFEVVIDTREQAPYSFADVRANVDKNEARYVVTTRRATIPVGDYSIFGYPQCVIERKSKADLYGSVARRKNFESRLERMNLLRYSAVIIEADWREILTDPPRHSKLNPKSLFRTVLAWDQRFPGVHWWAMPGREVAEATTFRMLERFWRDQQRVKQDADYHEAHQLQAQAQAQAQVQAQTR